MHRILHVLPAEPDNEQHGGPVVLISQILRVLAEQSCEVVSLAPLLGARRTEPSGKFVKQYRLSEHSLVRLHPSVFRYHWSSLNPTAMVDCLWRLRQFDVAVIHSYRTFLGTLAAVGCALHRIPYIVIPHGCCRYGLRNHQAKRGYDALIGRWLLRNAYCVVVSSRKELEEAQAAGLTGDFCIIPQGLPQPEFSEAIPLPAAYGLPAGERVILSLGRVVPPKNLELALEILARLPSGTRLLVVGELEEPDYYQRLQRYAQRLGVVERVHFVGAHYGPRKWATLKACDAFLSTSLYESFGLAIAEALSLGIPAVFPRTAGIAEYVSSWPLAFPRDLEPETMARAVEQALQLGRQEPLSVIGSELDWAVVRKRLWDVIASAILRKTHTPEGTAGMAGEPETPGHAGGIRPPLPAEEPVSSSPAVNSNCGTSGEPPNSGKRPVLLSVILVNYFTETLAVRCLNSIRADVPGADVEYLIVDNGSSRDWDTLLPPESAVRVLPMPDNAGFARAANRGLQETTGKYVLLINPDSVVCPGAVPAALEFLEAPENARVAILGPKVYDDAEHRSVQLSARSFPTLCTAVFNRYSLLTRIWPTNPWSRRYLKSGWDHSTVATVDWVSGCCMFCRRTALQQLGMFDEQYFMYVEDVDLCRRAGESGWTVVYFPRAAVVHSIAGSSRRHPVRMVIQHHRSMWTYFRKYYAVGKLGRIAVWLGICLRALLVATATAVGTSTRRLIP